MAGRAVDEKRIHGARLGFRMDNQTKELIARAAELERRTLTDFCLTSLANAARETIARHEMLTLSERDRQVLFDTLMNPPSPHPRLRQSFEADRTRIER